MKPSLPEGTLTFLFTDVEGSTSLWEQHPIPMQAALARHDALLRRAIESCRGHIIKNTGDGVFAVFSSALDAMAACLDVQRALQGTQGVVDDAVTHPTERLPSALRVRMGLHSGIAERRDGDYFGASLNRASRIMALAHGEQVLLSSATAELVRRQLPPGVALLEVGEHRLKGLLSPERLLQIVAPDLRTDFPPLAALAGNSLPAERDAFVGRSEFLAELGRRFDDGARLVSILGIGGTGKTRLATRFGWNSRGAFPGGIWFCDLTPARNANGIVHAVAHGLDVPLGKDDPVAQLGAAIARRGRCLVILDNFEQVARYAEETLGQWLNGAADALFLVTTREVLGLSGEEVLALAPLPSSDAVALFLRRAEAARPGFDPKAEDQPAIALLVKLLEGLPLAIELAAARVRVMAPKALLARMNERFTLLSSAGGRVDRQATLRAVFDWSWELLSLPEKKALAQMSTFQGGFTLPSAEAVLDLSDCEGTLLPMDALQSLVQKSFVRLVGDDRFDLLVSVQEYAAEHLRTAARYAGSGPLALLAAELRHGTYFASLDENAVVADGCIELDNLVLACRRAVAREDVDIAVRSLQGAWAGLQMRGPYAVAVELAAAARNCPGLDAGSISLIEFVHGDALAGCGREKEAHLHFETSLALSREVGNRHCEFRALKGLGDISTLSGNLKSARTHLEAALAVALVVRDRSMEARAHSSLGNLESAHGRLAEAQRHYEAAVTLARDAGEKYLEGAMHCNLGAICIDQGRMSEGRWHAESALAVAQQFGNRKLEGNTLNNLGLLCQIQGDIEEALVHLGAALEVARDLGHAYLESTVFCNLGLAFESAGRMDEAREHLEAAVAVSRAVRDRRSEGMSLGYLGRLRARASCFDDARLSLVAGESMLREVSDRLNLAILLCNRAETECLAGHRGAATAAIEEADSIGSAIEVGVESELGRALARVRRLVANPQLMQS